MTGPRLAKFHSRLAKGGVGLCTVAYGAVTLDGMTFKHQHCFEGAPSIEAVFRETVDAVHKANGKVCIQLTHAGAFADTPRPVSAVSWAPNPMTYRFSTAMTLADETRIVEAYASAARQAKRIGFDAVEVHCGHGYLLSQCILAGRCDFAVRVVARVCAVAKEVGGLAVLVKMNCDDVSTSTVAQRMRQFIDAGADVP